jgi:hypothetical protein
MGIIATVDEDFESSPVRQSDELTLTLDGWEGPLDLLLSLARAQKVDLAGYLLLLENGEVTGAWPASTAANGIGGRSGSFQTPPIPFPRIIRCPMAPPRGHHFSAIA